MRTMKKALSLILALAMCISMVSGVVFADETVEEEIILLEESEEEATPAVVYKPNPQIFDTTEPLGFVIDSAQASTEAGYLGWHSLDIVTEPALNKVGYTVYDENGYEKSRQYTVTYTDADGTEYTGATLTYTELMALIEETKKEDTSASITSIALGAFSKVSTSLYTGQAFTNFHCFAIIGSALESGNVYNLRVHRNWSEKLAPAQVSSGGTAASATKNDSVYAKYSAYLADKNNYLYSVAPNQDATLYYFSYTSNTIGSELLEDWTYVDNTGALTISNVPQESFTEPYQPLWAEGSNLNITNAVTGATIAKAWYMVDSRYNPENYPYFMSKIQYDAHATVYYTYPYMWYKEVKAGEEVKIPCFGVAGQETPKVMIRYGEHISDDVSGKVKAQSDTAVTSRVDTELDITVGYDRQVTFVPTDDTAAYEFSNTADFADTYQVVDMSEETEKTVYLKVTAAAGNDVVYTLNLEVDDNTNGTLKVGSQELSLKNKKTRYFLTGVSVGDAVSFTPDDATAEYSLDIQTVERVPQMASVKVTAANGDKWSYEVILSEEDVYSITNVSYASGAFLDGSPYRMYPKGDYKTDTMTLAEINEIVARYGTIDKSDADFWAGTDMYHSYPAKSGTTGAYYIDNPAAVTTANTSATLLNGETYIFKHNKQRVNKSDYYYGGVDTYDGTDGNYYLSFTINKPGTMYLVDKEGKGMPNAVAAGFEADSSIMIQGSTKVYKKHFDIPEGEETTVVNVPSYGWNDEWNLTLETTTTATDGTTKTTDTRTWKNPSYFAFSFDTERDTSIESITYTGAASGSIEISDTQTEYDVKLLNSVNGEITFDIKTTDSNAVIEPESVTANIVNGAGSVEFTVVSADGLAVTEYKINFIAAGDNKIIDVTSGYGLGWDSAIYEPEATYGIRAVEFVPEADTEFVYMTNGSTGTASKHFEGATYIKMVKNEGAATYTAHNVYRYDEESKAWVSDEKATYTITTNGEAVEKTAVKNSYNGSPAGTVRLITSPTSELDYFANNYNGVDNPWYKTFRVTSDCRVYIADRIGGGYPNLDKNLWTKNTDSSVKYASTTSLYYRDYKAGDVVEIPSYGMPEVLKDETPVTITYHDADGDEQTYTSTVGDETIYLDNIYVAVAWKADATLTDLAIDGETIEGFDSSVTAYTAEIIDGETPVVTYTAADGASVTEKKGEAADGKMTYTYTVENGVYSTVYTIEFKIISTDATLKSLAYTVDGTTNEFDLSAETYTAELPKGATSVTVSAEATDANASVSIEQADIANGKLTAVVTVTAEDGVTTKEYTVTFTEYKAPQVSVSISTNGTNIKATVNGSETDFDVSKTASYDYGTEITLTAAGKENQTFMYWKEAKGTIISTDATITITAVTAKSLVAVFSDETIPTVSFRSNGKIIAEGTSGSISVPADPYVAGYTFAGWYLDSKLVGEDDFDYEVIDDVKYVVVSADTVYQAGYKLDETTYEVTVNGETKEYKYNDKVTVTADSEKDGETFSHWEKDGITVSYSETYSFYVSGKTTLVAVYGEDAEKADVIVTLAQPTVVAGDKIAFYAERSVDADKYTIIETGILLSSTAADVSLDNYEIKATAKSTANNGQYTIRKANVKSGEVWYGVAYVIYKDAEGNIYKAHSQVMKGSIDE